MKTKTTSARSRGRSRCSRCSRAIMWWESGRRLRRRVRSTWSLSTFRRTCWTWLRSTPRGCRYILGNPGQFHPRDRIQNRQVPQVSTHQKRHPPRYQAREHLIEPGQERFKALRFRIRPVHSFELKIDDGLCGDPVVPQSWAVGWGTVP